MRESWREVALGSLATQRFDSVELNDTTLYSNLGVKWYAAGTFQREPKFGADIKASKLFRVRPGQFVYNRLFATEGSFALVQRHDANAVASNEFPVFDVDESQILGAYLYLYFQQPSLWKQVSEQCVGTTKSRLRWKEDRFLAHRLPLPPLPEQRRIADLIGALDDTIAAAEAAKATAVRLLDQFVNYELDAAEGRSVRLGDVMQVVRGGSPRPIDKFYTESTEGVNWVRIGDVGLDGKYITRTEKRILPSGLTRTRTVEPGDFVLSNSMSFGRPYIMRIAGCIHDGWLKLSNFKDSLDEDYLYYMLRGQRVQRAFETLAAGSSVRNLNKDKVASIEVVLPELSAQRDIAARLDRMGESVVAHESVTSNLCSLRSNLLTALLSGEHEIPESYDELLEEAS